MESIDEITYHTPNGIIKKIDLFKGKKVLIGDYSSASYFNTKMVLDSLGIEYDIASDIEAVKNLVSANRYDIIFSNNIYQHRNWSNAITRTKISKRL